MTVSLAVVAALMSAESLLAHHSLASFDTEKPVRVKGAIVEVHQINPHSIIYVQETDADGKTRRWAVEGPSIVQIQRRGLPKNVLIPGLVIEVCGYLPKEATVWQIANPNPGAVSLAGRLLNAEMLVLPDGKIQSWGDYGVHKCFPPDYRDAHSK